MTDGTHKSLIVLYMYVIASPDKSIPPPPESKFWSLLILATADVICSLDFDWHTRDGYYRLCHESYRYHQQPSVVRVIIHRGSREKEYKPGLSSSERVWSDQLSRLCWIDAGRGRFADSGHVPSTERARIFSKATAAAAVEERVQPRQREKT